MRALLPGLVPIASSPCTEVLSSWSMAIEAVRPTTASSPSPFSPVHSRVTAMSPDTAHRSSFCPLPEMPAIPTISPE